MNQIIKNVIQYLLLSLLCGSIFGDRLNSKDTTMKKLPSAASSRQLLVPVQGGFGIGDGVGGIGLGTGYPGFYGLAGLGPWGAGYGLITDTNPATGMTQGSRLVKFSNVDQPFSEVIRNLIGGGTPNVNITSNATLA